MTSIANGESGASVRAKLNALLASANVSVYVSRPALVTAWTDGQLPDGSIVSDGTVFYKAESGSVFITDLPGLLPFDPSGEYDCFIEHFRETSATSSVNSTTALQRAIDYCEAIGSGTFGQGGKIGLKAREYTLSDTDADGYCVTVQKSMTIEGAGPNSTTFYINSATDTMFYVGAGDAAILADTSNTATVDKVIFRGIQFSNVDTDTPTGTCAVLADRAVVECHECRFLNFYRSITLLGNPEGCRISNCDIVAGSNAAPRLDYDAQTGNFTVGLTITGGTSGATAVISADTDSGTTGTLTLTSVSGLFEDNETITDTSTGSATTNGLLTGQSGSAGIVVDRRQVNAAFPGAYLDSVDGLYYLEPNYVLIENCNIRMGATTSQYGGAYAVRVGAADTLVIDNCHLAWGYIAPIGFIPSQANMSFTDVRVSGGLIDPLPGKSRYGVYGADTSGVTPTVMGSISISDTSISGAALDGVNWAVNCRRFKMDNVDVKGCGRYGIIINSATCRNASITNCDVFDTNGDGGTAAAIYVDNCDRLRIIGNNIETGFRGIQLTANSGRVVMIGNQINSMTDSRSIYLPASFTPELTAANNDIEESTTIASATRLRLPVGQDHFYITGASDIWELRIDAPSSAYANRVVWLTFAGAATLKDDGGTPPGSEVPNLQITADFICAAGTVVGLKWDATLSKWIIVSTRANA